MSDNLDERVFDTFLRNISSVVPLQQAVSNTVCYLLT